jgi:hypothetical protein
MPEKNIILPYLTWGVFIGLYLYILDKYTQQNLALMGVIKQLNHKQWGVNKLWLW